MMSSKESIKVSVHNELFTFVLTKAFFFTLLKAILSGIIRVLSKSFCCRSVQWILKYIHDVWKKDIFFKCFENILKLLDKEKSL